MMTDGDRSRRNYIFLPGDLHFGWLTSLGLQSPLCLCVSLQNFELERNQGSLWKAFIFRTW